MEPCEDDTGRNDTTGKSGQKKTVQTYKQWQKELREYHLHSLSILTSFMVAVIGALFPVISILILYEIKSTLVRIYALIGLTIGFSVVVKCATRAKTSDVFSITAA